MSLPNYDKLAERTLSRGFNAEGYNPLYILADLAEFIPVAEGFDRWKRLVFYTDRQDAVPEFFKPISEDALHGILGILSEAAELALALQVALSNKAPLDYTNIKEELGDFEWYMSAIRRALGMTQHEVQEANILKLKARYPEKFAEQQAKERNLTKEMEALGAFTSEPVIVGQEEMSAMRVLGLSALEYSRLQEYLRIPSKNWPVELQSFVRDYRLRNEGLPGITIDCILAAFIKQDPNPETVEGPNQE